MSNGNRFNRFVGELANNPTTLRAYRADAEAAMTAAGLSDEEKGVLRTGDFGVVCDFLSEGGPRPIPDPQPGGSGGGSGGSGSSG